MSKEESFVHEGKSGKKIDWKNIAIIVLSICLASTLFYMGFVRYQEKMVAGAYTDGYNTALRDTVADLYQKTEDCQIATINIGNMTRSVADVECIDNVLAQLRAEMQQPQEFLPDIVGQDMTASD